MNDDLREIFLPRFAAKAHARLDLARAAATEHRHEDTQKTIADLHSIAGDAGLLGLSGISALAAACEARARTAHNSHSDAELDALVGALDELRGAIDRRPPV
jgi:HPt (histidine-containing phosphotransfer) domain-containing protein